MRTWRLALLGLVWSCVLALSACGGGGSPVNTPQQGSEGDLTIELERLAAVQNTRIVPIRVIFPSTNAADDIPVWIRLGYKLSLNISERINNMSAASGTPDFNDPAQVFMIPPDGTDFTLFWDAAADLGNEANEDTVVIRAGVLRTNADDPREAVCDFQPVVQVILDEAGICENLPPRIDDQTLPTLTPGQPYTQQVEFADGESPFTFDILDPDTGDSTDTNDILPGLVLDEETGLISGTASGVDSSQIEFFVRVSDSCGSDDGENNQNQAVRANQQAFSTPTRFDIARIVIPVATAECPELGPEIDSEVQVRIGENLELQLQASGGTGALSWEQTGGTMLPNLELTSSGLLTGRVGAYSVSPAPRVQVSDSCIPPRTDEADLNFTILCAEEAPSFDFGEVPQGMYGEAYDYTFTVDYPGLFAVLDQVDGNLPPGLEFEVTPASDGFTAECQISGIIEEIPSSKIVREGQGGVSTSDFFESTWRAADACPSDPLSTIENLTIEVLPEGGCPPLNITTTALPNGQFEVPYSFQVEANGGEGARFWSTDGGKGGNTLPNGLTIDSSSGLISGTPTQFGLFDVEIVVVDQCTPTPQFDGTTLTLTIEPPTCAALALDRPITLPTAFNGTPYNFTITATGGEGQLTFAAVANPDNLPAGLTLTADGVLSGTTVDEPGDYVFDVTVTDECVAGAQLDTETVTLTLQDPPTCDPIVAKPPSLPTTIINGEPQDFQVVASGGEGTLTFSIEANPDTLPFGLALSTSGQLTGIAKDKVGDYTFDLVITDECTTPGPQEYRETITMTLLDACAPIAITTKSLPDAVNFEDYDFSFTADGEPPFSWSIIAGNLPLGLSMDTDGRITGNPKDKSGQYDITVEVRDSCALGAQVTSDSYRLNLVDACPDVQIIPGTLPTAQNNIPYSFQFQVIAGTPPFAWTLNAGSDPLPDGLLLDTGGLLSGIPDDGAGTYNLILDVMDSCPNGAMMDTEAFTLTLEDVNCDPIEIGKQFVPAIVIGQPYSYQLLASGGFGTLTWALDPKSDPLPDGITLDATGLLSGTVPDGSEPMEFNFAASVSDECPAGIQTELYTQLVNVVCVSLGPLGGTPPTMFQNEEYFFQPILVGGGVPPLFWDIDNNFGTGLPAGIGIDANTGEITGRPDASSGSYTFRVVVTDSCDIQQSVSQDYSLLLEDCRPLGPITGTPGDLVNGEPFSFTPGLTSAGSPPYTWFVNGKVSLPNGLVLDDETGEISGTPNEIPGSYLIPIGVSDSCKQFESTEFTFRIAQNPACPPISITNTGFPDPFVFSGYFESLMASGGSGEYEWRLAPDSGPLPDGLVVDDSDGWAINGFPNNPNQVDQTFTFTLQAIDRTGCNLGVVIDEREFTFTLRQGT